MVASFLALAAFSFAFVFFDTFYGLSGADKENLIQAGVTPSSATPDFWVIILSGVIAGYVGLILGYLLLARPKKLQEANEDVPIFKSKPFFYWLRMPIFIHVLSYLFFVWAKSFGAGAIIFMLPPLFLLPILANIGMYCSLPIGAIGMSISLTRYIRKNREIQTSDFALLWGGVIIFAMLGFWLAVY